MAEQVPGIDAVLVGHGHEEIAAAVRAPSPAPTSPIVGSSRGDRSGRLRSRPRWTSAGSTRRLASWSSPSWQMANRGVDRAGGLRGDVVDQAFGSGLVETRQDQIDIGSGPERRLGVVDQLGWPTPTTD
ncbi:hypothetical protein [Kribbella endophytica]